MRLAPIVRPKRRNAATAPLDALIAMAILAGAALTILPMMAALSLFALIAMMVKGRTPRPRALPVGAR